MEAELAKFEAEPASTAEQCDDLLRLLLRLHPANDVRWKAIQTAWKRCSSVEKSAQWLKNRAKKLQAEDQISGGNGTAAGISMAFPTGLVWHEASDGRLGVFTSRAVLAGDVVERCYCMPLKPTDVPGQQLLPWLYDPGHGNNSGEDRPMLFPLGWGLLYNECSAEAGTPNLTWEHEVTADAQGHQRDYIVLRAVGDIAAGEELCAPRNFHGGSGLRDMLSSAISALEALPGVELLPAPSAAAGDEAMDIRGGSLDAGYPAARGIEMRGSPLHGNGVFATRPFKKDDIVEMAPVLLILRWEIGNCLIDHRFNSHDVKPDNSTCKVALGMGSVFNHKNKPNVGYRPARTLECGKAQQYCSCYYALRDIAEGEELYITYGPGWWETRETPKEISLAHWRLKRGETELGRPFYDQPTFSKWCEKVGMSVKAVEDMHRAFVEAEDSEVEKLEAWNKLSDRLSEEVQIYGCLNAPLRETGERAAHRFAQMGYTENLKWLVLHRADMNAATAPALDMSPDGTASSSLCPAHVAAIYGKIEALTVLQSSGADLNCRRPDGATPLDFAEDMEQTEVASWLAARGGIKGIT